MTEIFCFSGSGHSLSVAEFIAKALNGYIHLINHEVPVNTAFYETAIIVFPVYCQNIPNIVKSFLKNIRAKSIVLIATYGKISCGNVLLEAKRLASGKVIAGACVPIGHAFLNGTAEFDKEALQPILKRIKIPCEAKIPRKRKNIFADFLPAWRSRVSVKIVRAINCNLCNLCGNNCPMDAVKNGIINKKCIRCLRCVTNCPQKALSFKNSIILEKYLTKKYAEKNVEIY